MSAFRNKLWLMNSKKNPLDEIKDHYGSLYMAANLDSAINNSPDKDKILAEYPYMIINALGGGDRRLYASNYPIFVIGNGWGASLVMYVENMKEKPYVAYAAIGTQTVMFDYIGTAKISTNAVQMTEHWWDIKITCYGFTNPSEDIYRWK